VSGIAISYLELADEPLKVRCELREVFGSGGELFDGSGLLLDGGGGVLGETRDMRGALCNALCRCLPVLLLLAFLFLLVQINARGGEFQRL